MVVHVCNCSYVEGRDKRTAVQARLKKNLVKPFLKNKLGMVAHVYKSQLFGRLR
jgi:hypothetical protein